MIVKTNKLLFWHPLRSNRAMPKLLRSQKNTLQNEITPHVTDIRPLNVLLFDCYG